MELPDVRKFKVEDPYSKKTKKRKDEPEEEYIGPLLVDYAAKWEDAMFGKALLHSLEKTEMFDRYFELSKKLLEHPRAKMASVSYTNGGKKTYHIKQTVYINGTHPKKVDTVYEGITGKLRETFHPDTSDDPIERSKRNRLLGGRKPLNQKPIGKSPCKKKGAPHGTLVHNQIERMTKIITRKCDIEYYKRQEERLDMCTQSLVDECIKNKWFPLRSEFIIFDENLKVATASDLFLVDIIKWRLIKVELKTGYENEEYGIHPNDVKFPPPLNKITNCPLNRHQLQLLSMGIILEKRYDVKVDDMVIIRMCPKLRTIEIREPSNWCRMEYYKEVIYACLLYGRDYVLKNYVQKKEERECIYVG